MVFFQEEMPLDFLLKTEASLFPCRQNLPIRRSCRIGMLLFVNVTLSYLLASILIQISSS